MTRALLFAVWVWGYPAVRPPAAAPDERAERLAAVDRCRQGYANINPASPSVAADLARACADLYREPACAEAMRNPPKDPAQFASAVSSACRDAYCPHLPAPRPGLCASAALPAPTELLSQWGVLQQHILAFELGVDAKALAPLFQPVTVAVKRDPPKPVPPAGQATVKVFAATQGNGQVRLWIENRNSIVVREDAVADAAASLAHDARATAPQDAQILLAIDKKLPHGLVVSLIDAFKQEGFGKFAFMVAPAK
jgi:biopolymer transport protein ExbD